jgi:flagellar biosynthetic protein FliP
MARQLSRVALPASVLAALIVVGVSAHAAGLGVLDLAPDNHGGQTYTVPVQLLLLMTGLVFIPAVLLTMTAFTRIIIVLALLRQALGLTQTPPNQILIGLSLFLTVFVMGPVVTRVNSDALQPLLNDKISVMDAVDRSEGPLKTFMLKQTRRDDLGLFLKLAGGQTFKSASSSSCRSS